MIEWERNQRNSRPRQPFFPSVDKKNSGGGRKRKRVERDKGDERKREREKDCIVWLDAVITRSGYLAMMAETMRERWTKRQVKKGYLEAKNLLSGLRVSLCRQ